MKRATLGSEIRRWRRERGMTQAELSAASRVTQGTISSIESERTLHPSWLVVARIECALELEPSELIAAIDIGLERKRKKARR